MPTGSHLLRWQAKEIQKSQDILCSKDRERREIWKLLGAAPRQPLFPVSCVLSTSTNLLWETKDCTGTTAQVPKAPGCSLHLPKYARSILVSQQDCSQYRYYSQLKVPLRYHTGNYSFFLLLIWQMPRVSTSAH